MRACVCPNPGPSQRPCHRHCRRAAHSGAIAVPARARRPPTSSAAPAPTLVQVRAPPLSLLLLSLLHSSGATPSARPSAGARTVAVAVATTQLRRRPPSAEQRHPAHQRRPQPQRPPQCGCARCHRRCRCRLRCTAPAPPLECGSAPSSAPALPTAPVPALVWVRAPPPSPSSPHSSSATPRVWSSAIQRASADHSPNARPGVGARATAVAVVAAQLWRCPPSADQRHPARQRRPQPQRLPWCGCARHRRRRRRHTV
eukprot:COSAG01_NODE_3448_length_6086_cov_4.407049_2_plen_257_part_00